MLSPYLALTNLIPVLLFLHSVYCSIDSLNYSKEAKRMKWSEFGNYMTKLNEAVRTAGFDMKDIEIRGDDLHNRTELTNKKYSREQKVFVDPEHQSLREMSDLMKNAWS